MSREEEEEEERAEEAEGILEYCLNQRPCREIIYEVIWFEDFCALVRVSSTLKKICDREDVRKGFWLDATDLALSVSPCAKHPEYYRFAKALDSNTVFRRILGMWLNVGPYPFKLLDLTKRFVRLGDLQKQSALFSVSDYCTRANGVAETVCWLLKNGASYEAAYFWPHEIFDPPYEKVWINSNFCAKFIAEDVFDFLLSCVYDEKKKETAKSEATKAGKEAEKEAEADINMKRLQNAFLKSMDDLEEQCTRERLFDRTRQVNFWNKRYNKHANRPRLLLYDN